MNTSPQAGRVASCAPPEFRTPLGNLRGARGTARPTDRGLVLWTGTLLALQCLLSGCLLKPTTVDTRTFVLAPVSTNAPASTAPPLTLGIARVRLPAYLERSALVVRRGTNEIEYLENALWAERLDRAFQRTLAANLARLVPTDRIHPTDWHPEDVACAVEVTVEQFDVDSNGQGTLLARWQLAAPAAHKVLRTGQSRLTRTGAAPGRDPAAMVKTLNELVGELSEELAEAVRECTAGAAPPPTKLD
jgi:uncharacterized lipoprotein YmbA